MILNPLTTCALHLKSEAVDFAFHEINEIKLSRRQLCLFLLFPLLAVPALPPSLANKKKMMTCKGLHGFALNISSQTRLRSKKKN